MITVGKMMELDIMRTNLKLLAGEKGLYKEVNYITIMEAPDFYEWVSGGEFVLTSWYAYSGDPTGQEYAFTELAKRISCIGIKVDRYLKTVPQVLINLANEYNVPLFAIKRETKFREIIYSVAAEVQNAQTNILLKVEKHYNDLVKAALASDDFSPVLHISAKNINKKCFCFNAVGEYIGGEFPSGGDRAALKWHARDFYKKNMQDMMQDYDGRIRMRVGEFEVFFCTARNFVLGFLVIVSEEELSESDVLIAQQTVSILSLKLLEQHEKRQKRMSELLNDIKKGLTIESELDFFALKWQKKKLYVARLSCRGKNIIELIGESSFLKSTDRILPIIDGKEIVFIGTEEIYTDERITPKVLEELYNWISGKYTSDKFVLAIGPRVDNLTELKESLVLAGKTAAVAAGMGKYGCLDSRDWLLPSVLINQLGSAEINQISKKVLEPILEHDKKYKSDLFNTLRTLATTGRTDLAASQLHIHVNTLRYRLSKIRDLTGYDSSVLQDFNILILAVIVGEIENNRKNNI